MSPVLSEHGYQNLLNRNWDLNLGSLPPSDLLNPFILKGALFRGVGAPHEYRMTPIGYDAREEIHLDTISVPGFLIAFLK